MHIITTRHVIMLILISAIITAALITINNSLKDYLLSPEVYTTKKGECVKVINYQNGHAFNCNDVDVILRQYRKVTEE